MLFQIPQRYRFSSKSQPNSSGSIPFSSCFRYHKGTDFQANHNRRRPMQCQLKVVLDTTKVQIFKQITTPEQNKKAYSQLFQIPQRYRFSSKSQPNSSGSIPFSVVLDTTKVQIFKQITTIIMSSSLCFCCFRYHKGTDFQANHNKDGAFKLLNMLFQIPQRYRFSSKSQQVECTGRFKLVVLDTTKVQIFKQITTSIGKCWIDSKLFQIPQRYRFSSKSQHINLSSLSNNSCFRYHKGTDFQANHNTLLLVHTVMYVVLDTTKVQIFKQITTKFYREYDLLLLFQIPQRYRFSSKSQLTLAIFIYFLVVLDTTKVQIFKQITTKKYHLLYSCVLFQIPQRYRFSSKSQLIKVLTSFRFCCFRYHKGTDFQANHNYKWQSYPSR